MGTGRSPAGVGKKHGSLTSIARLALGAEVDPHIVAAGHVEVSLPCHCFERSLAVTATEDQICRYTLVALIAYNHGSKKANLGTPFEVLLNSSDSRAKCVELFVMRRKFI